MATRRAAAPATPDRTFIERFGGVTTWMIGTFAGGLFSIGFNYAQFQQIKLAQLEGKEEQKLQAAKLADFREKQVSSLRDIDVLKTNVQGLDSRVLVIERVFIEKAPQLVSQGNKGDK